MLAKLFGEYNRLTGIYKIVKPLHSLKVWCGLRIYFNFIKGWMMC